MAQLKKRLDIILVERELFESRRMAQAAIMEGRILVDEVKIEKAGHQVNPDCDIRILGEDPKYVSRGGLKLEAALEHFDLIVSGKLCLDVGASTGGFTDCLLQRGASKVVALDVGKGQLHNKLRQDNRVEIRDGVNARLLSEDAFDTRFDIITIDVSFISQRLILPALKQHLKEDGVVVALIKPQFEVGKDRVGKGGVVRDDIARREVVINLVGFYKSNGFDVLGTIKSPIKGADGNIEHLIAAEKR